MKRILFTLLMMIGVAYGQVCADTDTVRSNTATLITANSVRINGTTAHFTGAVTSLQLKYVRVGLTDTITSTGASALRNLTGLYASTQYYYYYKTICGSGTNSQTIGAYSFTTLANTVLYAPERPTVFNHLKVDSSMIIPEGDTLVGREPSTRAQIRYKTSDNTFYGYYPDCTCWRALAIDSSGIIGLLDGKVDSVTVSGDSLFYWKVGVSYGYILPSVATVWHTDGNAGIDTSADFIGTTDNVDFPIKTNDVRRFTVNTNGALGIGATPDYGTSGYRLVSSGSGAAPTWSANTISSLTAAAATNSIDNENYTQTWQWNSRTGLFPGFIISSTSTALSGTIPLLSVTSGGANGTAGRTAAAAQFISGNTGSTSTNVGLIGSATGATTNYAARFTRGIVEFGTVGTEGGHLHINGGTSGTISVVPQAAAGTYNFNLPTTSGNSGEVLTSAGGASSAMTWTAPVTPSSTTTFTNKRWTARVGSTTSSATPTINTDNYDIYKLTAQTADITSFTTNLSGTPVDGDILEIQVTGTAARAIVWGASFVSTTVTLPATTVTTATLTIILQYYTTSSYGNNKWHCVNYY